MREGNSREAPRGRQALCLDAVSVAHGLAPALRGHAGRRVPRINARLQNESHAEEGRWHTSAHVQE